MASEAGKLGEAVKLAAGTLVVGAAMVIMLPGLLGFAAGLTRMLIIVGLAAVASLAFAFFLHHMTKSKTARRQPPAAERESEKEARP